MSEVQVSAIRLGLIWRRLDGIVDQVAETFLRAAFSVVVRDNYDMAFSIYRNYTSDSFRQWINTLQCREIPESSWKYASTYSQLCGVGFTCRRSVNTIGHDG